MNDSFGMFAKYWQPGTVKTRLAASVGAQTAAIIQQRLVESTLSRFGQVADRRTLAIWPASRIDAFRPLAGYAWNVISQCPGDLGSRMFDFFERQFSSGAAKVVLIGSDCPQIEARTVSEAFVQLEHADLVIGPSEDGGYYLIGMKQPLPAIFSGIPWSTAEVLERTLHVAKRAGLTSALLQTDFDIDTIEDLKKFLDMPVSAELVPLQLSVREMIADNLRANSGATGTESK